ncbi:DUF1093 domain-containing protein [Vagococcus xieshaowenii]|uniref:DUF1093 domain-containing protein n=1 Tax=Vagococcus xieshaowenii TaxID=2562451 RepID=A0AAJ5EFV7_9ENTE|nr:DUF1093 domain-containing protein [Vagococcus xieshaowenii]QCA28417.1 DUF1093 domain-containing protein [Vagococcus xieshaowenii]TFZ42827.1 DUF1093 domain-containing protein [Vagococcus xieshaowenii]
MKKLFGLIVVLLLAFGGYKVWDYYQSTYVGQDYYGVISDPLPELTTIKDVSGNPLGDGYKYQVTSYDKDGKARQLEFDVITTGKYKDGAAYEAGTIIKFNASEKRIIKKAVISIDDVPNNIKNKLQ